jgi:hypothetical protein
MSFWKKLKIKAILRYAMIRRRIIVSGVTIKPEG